MFQHCNIGACACEQQECRRTARVRPAPHSHATGRSSVSHSRIQPQHVSELQPSHLRPEHRSRQPQYQDCQIPFPGRHHALSLNVEKLGRKSEQGRLRPRREDGLQQYLIRRRLSTPPEPHPTGQCVCVCVCKMNETFRFLMFSMCGRA